MNAVNVALSEIAAQTGVLADGDDHGESVPHGWPVASFIRAVKGGATISVRGTPHRVGILMAPDSVALYHQTFHSSALAHFSMPHNGATKEQVQQLELLLNVTHTVATQQDMYDHTFAPWYRSNPDKHIRPTRLVGS